MSNRKSWYSPKKTYPKMTFFVEGDVTEREYIDNLKKSILKEISDGQKRKRLKDSIEVSDVTAQDACSLVNLAINSHPKKTDVCVIVIDEDDRTTVHEKDARNKAIQIAKNKGFVFVYSIPCFEFWALLHLQNTSACLSRKQCQKKLRDLMPQYNHHKNKSLKLDFQMLSPHYDEAAQRAKNLIDQHSKKCLDIDLENPTTNAFLIKTEIEKFIRNFPK
jgi:hypothetical protein